MVVDAVPVASVVAVAAWEPNVNVTVLFGSNAFVVVSLSTALTVAMSEYCLVTSPLYVSEVGRLLTVVVTEAEFALGPRSGVLDDTLAALVTLGNADGSTVARI